MSPYFPYSILSQLTFLNLSLTSSNSQVDNLFYYICYVEGVNFYVVSSQDK